MINIDNETILSLEDAAIYFSKLSGRSRNREVVRRWINRGCNGVVLESISIGRDVFTSKQAISRWVHRCDVALKISRVKKTPERFQTEAETIRQIDQAAADLGLTIHA